MPANINLQLFLGMAIVYRDLQARGYAAKGGFGFGADFCVHDRGRFGDKAAS